MRRRFMMIYSFINKGKRNRWLVTVMCYNRMSSPAQILPGLGTRKEPKPPGTMSYVADS